jgi:glycosyltransferase involved in cell wall biosynthesis
MSPALISLVLPVYNEGQNIGECLRRIERGLAGEPHEILVCYDMDEDTTLPAIAAMPDRPASVRLVKNTLGRGAPKAMRAGFAAARGDVIVTTMADLSDPPELVPRMAQMVRAGAEVVSGSRYMRGGSQQGGPLLKRTLSRSAGLLLYWICGLRTRDPTNNFRAYSPQFLAGVVVESSGGFEIALELTVKAHLAGARVSEIPSSWVDRSAGKSRFRLWKWMPNYLRWFARAVLAPVLALAVLLAAALWAAHAGGTAVLLHSGIALAVLALARIVRGRNTRWDILQPALWILPPLSIEAGPLLWGGTALASAALFGVSLARERLRSRPASPAR